MKHVFIALLLMGYIATGEITCNGNICQCAFGNISFFV